MILAIFNMIFFLFFKLYIYWGLIEETHIVYFIRKIITILSKILN
jgi:hypothetical protein